MTKDDQVALGSTAAAPTGTDLHDGGPAFPQPIAEIHGRATNSCEFAMPGMSLRDYFAARALNFLGTIDNGTN